MVLCECSEKDKVKYINQLNIGNCWMKSVLLQIGEPKDVMYGKIISLKLKFKLTWSGIVRIWRGNKNGENKENTGLNAIIYESYNRLTVPL